MRITNNILRESTLKNIQRNQAQMASAQQQVSSGIKLTRASDDPAGTATAMRARGGLQALSQYRRTVDIARTKATEEETALDGLANVLVRARELSVAFADDSVSTEARQAGAAEAEQLFRSAIRFANTLDGGTYVFGGHDGTVLPYDVTGTSGALGFSSTTPTGATEVEISANQRVAVSHSGTAAFEDTDALAALRDLANALAIGDGATVRASTTRTVMAHDAVLGVQIEVGARVNLLDSTEANIDALEINLKTLKSSVEEVDIEKAVTELIGRQTALQAAMLATSRVMGLTITDYLR